METSIRTLISILSGFPRIREKTASNIALSFLSDREVWNDFSETINKMLGFGTCVCGNIPSNAEEKHLENILCDFCKTPRSDLIIVSDIMSMYRFEDLLPDRHYYHVIRQDDDEQFSQDLMFFVRNIQHKYTKLGYYPRIINGMGNDENSRECIKMIRDIMVEDLNIPDVEKLLVDLPVGIPLNRSMSNVDDGTILSVFSK